MKRMATRYRREIAGALIGGVAGWCYWYFVGCASGTCPITAHPLNSVAYGAVMGLLIAGLINNKKKDK